MQIMIEFANVTKSFNGKTVLKDLSFKVMEGDTFVLMGPSGTGKSVTLKHIIGVFAPDKGEIIVDGVDVNKIPFAELRELRKHIGFLFQDGALMNWMNVYDNVALPLRETTDLAEKKIHEKVSEKLQMMKLEEHKTKMPAEISGGMRKRVSLARALVTEPKIILYDEPTSGLDPEMSGTINQLIIDLKQNLNVTSLVVTHSVRCAMTVADRIGVLDQGKIVQEGSPEEIRTNPTDRVRRFLGDACD